MGDVIDLSSFTRSRDGGRAEMDLALEGVSCGGCIARIEGGLKRLPGIDEVRVNFTNRRAHVAWTKGVTSPEAIVAEVERLGYGAHPFVAQQVEDDEAREANRLLRYLAVAGFAAMNIMLLSVSVWSGNVSDITPETRDLFHWLSAVIALPAVAYAGQPFFRSAFGALRVRSVNMDVPIALGVLLATGMSLVETINHAEHAYFDSAVMLLFFLLCGRYLDRAMRRRTRAVAGNLAALRAQTAHRVQKDGTVVEVPASSLRPRDTIIVRPGDRLPADGVVIAGTSEIDESMVTGETARRALKGGETVYAGSLNFTGALTLRITAAGERTLLDEIERLLDNAVKSKSRRVQLADRAARLYAPLVHTAAALTLTGWLLAGAGLHASVMAAIAVLIITCPCALALAVPAVQVVAAGRMFRGGIILNSGDAIERLAEVDTVAFDKTGTLTLPEARVTNAGLVARDMLETAARLALSSRHPLAAALAREANERRMFEDVSEHPGEGVSVEIDGRAARLGSPAFCDAVWTANQYGAASADSLIAFRHGDETAIFVVQQTLRPDARAVVQALRGRGLAVCILSGDRAEAVAPVAAALGIEDWQAGLMPGRKVELLRDLKARGKRVLMVGDGINDAPSLAEAHVSLSPITAAEISQAHADAVFVGQRLDPVAEALAISRDARRLMTQNLLLAVIYNAIAVPIAVAGLVTPLIAALAMSGSSLLVTGNALRLSFAWPFRKAEAGPPTETRQAKLAMP
ncbi:MAG TPA: heavy metal translocating P-type ATPase [Xanthobacteraceae bacterium]|nr:heavy metal translocating P-type ATPase [Xanthobacteraceae bacterium]